MKLFKQTGKAQKNWRRKALFLDLSRTRIVLVAGPRLKPKHVPSWIASKEPDSSIKQASEISRIRKEYGPLDFHQRYCH